MQRAFRALVAGLVLLGIAGMPVAADETWQPTPGGWVSGDLDWHTTVPLDAGTAIDAVLHDDVLYVTSWRGFSVYDVSDPLDPKRLHHEPTEPHLINEQPQTNGEILLLSNDAWAGTLEIWDITEPSSPVHVTSFANPKGDHIWACVLDCSYAYSSHGTILDLADPANPAAVGSWPAPPVGEAHHLAEVAPGLVLTGSTPMYLLDGTDDPANPAVLATVEPHSRAFGRPYLIVGGYSPSLPARVDWPLQATDRFALVSMESPFSGDCSESSGTFGTYDTADWEETGTFTLVAEYGLEGNGTYPEGKAPVNFWGCTTYGFEVHPDYDATRMLALTAMEHGIRLLEVDEEGAITEHGGFVPVAGSSATARWITDDVVYSIDLHRGIDVLTVTRP